MTQPEPEGGPSAGSGADAPDVAATDLEKAPISDVLQHFITSWSQERISLGDIVDGLGTRSFGLILLMLAVPNLFPIYIPGLSAILGIPMVIVAYQMFRQREHVGLPPVVKGRSVTIADFRRASDVVLPRMRMAERFLRPRFEVMADARHERLLGSILLVFALVVLFPFPFTNWLPALGICMISLGILQRDGIAVAVGTIIGLAGCVVAGAASVAVLGVLWTTFVSIVG